MKTCMVCKKNESEVKFHNNVNTCSKCKTRKDAEKLNARRSTNSQICVVCGESKKLLHFSLIGRKNHADKCKQCCRAATNKLAHEKSKQKEALAKIQEKERIIARKRKKNPHLMGFLTAIETPQLHSEMERKYPDSLKQALEKYFCFIKVENVKIKGKKRMCKRVYITSNGYKALYPFRELNPYENY